MNNDTVAQAEEGTSSSKQKQKQQQQQHSSLVGIHKVIFPNNKWIKLWDLVVLVSLFIQVFLLPYQIGVSGGVYIITNVWWFVVTVCLNSVFFIDTFLYFRRAYRLDTGRLVFNLKKIRRRYLRGYFIPNLISTLPFTIGFYVHGNWYIDNELHNPDTHFPQYYLLFKLLTLIRLTRVKFIVQSSDVIISYRLRHNSQTMQLWFYVCMVVIVSHWFACTWCFVAYIEASSFSEAALTSSANWIRTWADNNSEFGGIDPIGMFNDIDRYALSLFWAIQTITSIGYGNITPVTRTEYFVACLLQLCAGIMWAYIIGGLVGVTAAMQVQTEAYRSRTDNANHLIRHFLAKGIHDNDNNDDDKDGEEEEKGDNNTNEEEDHQHTSRFLARRIRRYIHNQYKISNTMSCASDFATQFPVYDSLSPELQRMSSMLVMKNYLELVPYLSSKYLSREEQCNVARDCIFVQFSAGEVCEMNHIGLSPKDEKFKWERGIFILQRGVATCRKVRRHQEQQETNDISRHSSGRRSSSFKARVLGSGMPIGIGEVFANDGSSASMCRLRFLTFCHIVFIPRSTVINAMSRSTKAWKQCARWIYLRTLLIDKLSCSRTGLLLSCSDETRVSGEEVGKKHTNEKITAENM